jgi:hypothetical protein
MKHASRPSKLRPFPLAGTAIRPKRGPSKAGGDDAESLAALTFEVTLVGGRPWLVPQRPYDVGRIRLL